jgi:protein-disulfide isomerase
MHAPNRNLKPRPALIVGFLLSWLLAPLALAQIGQAPGTIVERLSDYSPVPAQGGAYSAASDFQFRVHDVNGVTVSVSGQGALNDANIRFLGALVGAASGYGEGIAGPVADFFRSRAADLLGAGEVPIEVIEYLMYVAVEGGDTNSVAIRFEPDLVDQQLFGPPAHVLGPLDAPYVVREFTDLQCPYCATFAQQGMPIVRQLLERGDVRFELFHFPLKSIHPNAMAAAEAAECVAEEAAQAGAQAGEDAFWAYHDALFLQQARWSGLADPVNMFITIATDAGVPAQGLGLCVRSGRFTDQIEASYLNAAQDLSLTGTPTVFVGGLKVGDYRSLDEYLRLMRLSDALAAQE